MAKTKNVMVSLLIEDLDLYPRTSIDSSNVSRIADAISSGKKLPPIIADEKSGRVVDGVHRRRALLRLFGDEAEYPVEYREYPTEQDLYLDAVRLNSPHGKPITGSDRTHAIIRAIDLGISDDAIADAIGVTVEKVTTIATIKAGTFSPPKRAGRGSVEKVRRIPLKNSVRHLYGTDPNLTDDQVRVIDSSPGQSQWLLVRQLADLIEADLFDWHDERTVRELERLRNLLANHNAEASA